MVRDYVERRDNSFYIAGTRVPLDVIVQEYTNGPPAESIQRSFPVLSLEQIHGALAFYLANKAEASLRETDRKWDEFRAQHPAPAGLKERLEDARRELSSRG
jgi:uncharacterized protein (DUF433 family)